MEEEYKSGKDGIQQTLCAIVCIILLKMSCGSASAREYFTYDPAQENDVCLLQLHTNYALSVNGSKAGYLLPDDPQYGTNGLLPEVINGDRNSHTKTPTLKWKPAPSGRYWLVIELPDIRTVSAFLWYGRPEGSGGWARAPQEYQVRVSCDGKNWDTVAKQGAPSVYQKIHRFDPVKAKYVAMAEIKPSTHSDGTAIHEVGVYDLTEKVNYTLENPPWRNGNGRFRARLNEETTNTAAGIMRRNINFTELLKDRMGLGQLGKDEKLPPVVLSSISLVRCRKDGSGFTNETWPSQFIPDARFDLTNYAVGKMVWYSEPAAMKETWWLYADVDDKKSANASMPNLPFQIKVDEKSGTAEVSPLPAAGEITVYDDYGGIAGSASNTNVSVKVYPGRWYCPLGKQKGPAMAGPWFCLPEAKKQIKAQVDLPVWNYHRGKIIKGYVQLESTEPGEFSGSLTASLADRWGKLAGNTYEVKLSGATPSKTAFELETAKIASGDYGVVFELKSNDGRLIWTCEADISIAAPKYHHLEFGVDNLKNKLKWTRIMARHNITANFEDSGYVVKLQDQIALDEATACGINSYPRGPNEGLYPLGPQKVVTRDGTEYKGNWFSQSCPNDPRGLTNMACLVADKARELSQYGSFRGFVCFDDYNFPVVDLFKKDSRPRWTCYCEFCRERYRKKYNADLPKMDEMKWKAPVVPDDDPVLRFIVERCKAVGDYVANFEEAKASIDPSLEIGMLIMRNVFVPAGLWPPCQFGGAKVTSMYDYVSCSRILIGYLTLYEFNQMGNRGKKSWMLFEGNDVSQECINKKTVPFPTWAFRAQFWHCLSAGYKTMGLYRLCDVMLKDPDFDAEVRKTGAIVKKIGPLFGNVTPKRARAAILASFADFCPPDGDYYRWVAPNSTIMNIHRWLVTHDIPCEIVSDDEAAHGYLKNYDVVIIPDIQFIRKSAFEALSKYIAEGGTVLADKRSAVKVPGSVRLPLEPSLKNPLKSVIEEVSVYIKDSPASTANENVFFREFEISGGALFVLVNCQPDISGQLGRFGWGRMELIQPEAVSFRFKTKRRDLCYYDLLAGTLLQKKADGTVPITLEPGGGKIIICYERPVEKIKLTALPEKTVQGEKAVVVVEVLSDWGRSKGQHLLELQVRRPDGALSDEYSRFVLAENGRASLDFDFAVNDLPGRWPVKIIESASGKTVEFSLLVQKR